MLTASPASPLPEARLAVDVEGLAKVFGSPSAPVEVLRGISLAVQSGQRVALLGKSGSGKSTLLNLIGGLDRPTSGSIRVAGKELSRMTANELAEYRLATVGMIFQAYNLIPT
ncbi:MAG: ATP-binding cassette domain-containing protein [Isosphaeraceae bacterium]